MKADLIKYLRKINKKPSVQGKLLEQFISHGASTIPEMSKAIGVSYRQQQVPQRVDKRRTRQRDWKERQFFGTHPDGLRPRSNSRLLHRRQS